MTPFESTFMSNLAARANYDIDKIYMDGYNDEIINEQILVVTEPIFEKMENLDADVKTICDPRYL